MSVFFKSHAPKTNAHVLPRLVQLNANAWGGAYWTVVFEANIASICLRNDLHSDQRDFKPPLVEHWAGHYLMLGGEKCFMTRSTKTTQSDSIFKSGGWAGQWRCSNSLLCSTHLSVTSLAVMHYYCDWHHFTFYFFLCILSDVFFFFSFFLEKE